MTVDLSPGTSLSALAGYGSAPSREILNSTAHITRAGVNRGSEHCVKVQCTADEPVTTMASPMGAVR